MRLMRWMRKSGEPIYRRSHIVSLVLAVGLPLVLLQIYKIYVGPISFEIQLLVGVLTSIIAGIVLFLTYRSTAQNQP